MDRPPPLERVHDPITRRTALGVMLAPLVSGCMDALAPRTGPHALLSTADDPVLLIGAGDPHAHFTSRAFQVGKLIQAELDKNPSAWAFTVGDLVPHGTVAEYKAYHAAWGSFKERTLFEIGNHDRIADPTAKPYYDYVGDLGGPHGVGYYAKTMGSWRIYFLNSETARSTAQVNWLAADLPNWSNYHIMAMWHIPMFASVCVHNQRAMTMPGPLGVWWQLLLDHGADLVISGHTHRYERLSRMLRNGTVSSNGMRQFIVGTGGVDNMPILTVHPHSEKQLITHGMFKLWLYQNHYEWQFLDMSGIVQDSGSEATRTTIAV
jgi:Calcineurin-like phosphoesterase